MPPDCFVAACGFAHTRGYSDSSAGAGERCRRVHPIASKGEASCATFVRATVTTGPRSHSHSIPAGPASVAGARSRALLPGR